MLVSDNGTRFALDKGEITVLTSLMGAPDKRPSLAALWFYPAKGQAWATDGHRCVLADGGAPKTTTKNARPVTIPATTAAHAAKTARAADFVVVDVSRPKVSIDVRTPKHRGTEIKAFADLESKTGIKHSVTCSRHSGGPKAAAIEECFPSFQRRGSKGAVMAIDPAYLQSAAMLAKVTEPRFVWFNIGKAKEPAFFVAHGRHETTWRLVIMPWIARVEPPPIIAGTDEGATAKPRKGASAKGGDVRSAS